MAIELMDEHEKGEHVRAWLRQNGGAIIGGVAIGLALIFGYQWWERSKIEHKLTAATNFQALDDAIEAKDDAAASALSRELSEKFGDTAYASASTAPTAVSVSWRSSWSSGSWTFARWLSWRQPSPSNVSHRPVSASREPPGPSSSGQGCF